MPKKVGGEVHGIKVIKVDKGILAGTILSYIRGHKFHHQGEKPDKVILPRIAEVDGVPVEYEEAEDEVANDKE